MAKLGRLSRYKLAIKDYFNERPFFVPENYTWYRDDQNDESEKREYTLTVLQRFFVLLQEPSSCIMAGWVSNFVLLVILVNVVCNVLVYTVAVCTNYKQQM